jgi:His/Glu/Gln/Arg/opine family amino acid ABC transporter permease subunit
MRDEKSMNLDIIWTYLPLFLGGALVTIQIVLTAIFFATALGYCLAIMRRSHLGALRWFAAVYIWVFRGLPLLLGLFFFYYALPQWGIQLDAFTAGVAAMTLNSAAFFSEIIRAGMAAVPRGQLEAAVAVGMDPIQVATRVTLPQTVRLMLPPYISNCVIMLKESAQVAVITVPDLMFEAQRAYNATYSPLETLGVAGLLYLGITSALMLVQSVVERRLRAHALIK